MAIADFVSNRDDLQGRSVLRASPYDTQARRTSYTYCTYNRMTSPASPCRLPRPARLHIESGVTEPFVAHRCDERWLVVGTATSEALLPDSRLITQNKGGQPIRSPDILHRRFAQEVVLLRADLSSTHAHVSNCLRYRHLSTADDYEINQHAPTSNQ